jgi:kynurenine formamidase
MAAATQSSGNSSTALAQLVAGIVGGGIRVVDLTVPLEPATPTIQLPPQFAPSKSFTLEEISRYDSRGPAWYWNNIACGEHTGTHFDAPIHWVTGKDYANNATHNIPVDRFIGPACVIDVAQQARSNPDFLLTRAAVEAWEERHGRIPPHAWVLVRTDWSQRKGAKDFLNIGADGAHTPGFDPKCVPFLAKERDILGVGVETVGTDAGQAPTFEPMFPCHTIMHGSNRFGLASLTNLDQLPPTGAVVIAPPLKIVNGSGSPLRVLALVPA